MRIVFIFVLNEKQCDSFIYFIRKSKWEKNGKIFVAGLKSCDAFEKFIWKIALKYNNYRKIFDIRVRENNIKQITLKWIRQNKSKTSWNFEFLCYVSRAKHVI